MLWRRIAWFTSFAIAVALVLWMQSVGFGWAARIGAAVVGWVISQLCAAFILMRMHRRIHRVGALDALAGKVADAIKGLPPDEAEAVAKRMIDQSVK
jgi:hypothetical protein